MYERCAKEAIVNFLVRNLILLNYYKSQSVAQCFTCFQLPHNLLLEFPIFCDTTENDIQPPTHSFRAMKQIYKLYKEIK